MARPKKEGLDYFPLDVDIDQNDKIALIEAKHGLEGFGLVIKLLMKIYKEGYFYTWTEREQLLFSRKVNVDINSLREIVNDCIEWDLFHKDLFNEYQILTSEGIQKRYVDAVTRRKEVNFYESYLLIEPQDFVGNSKIKIFVVNHDGNKVNVNINTAKRGNGQHQVDINPQSKVKESKVKNNLFNDEDTREIIESLVANEIVKPGGFTKTLSDDLDDIFENFKFDSPKDVILEAIKISARGNGRTWRFVFGKIDLWRKQGVKKVLDAEMFENQQMQQPKRTGNFYKPLRQEITPDWMPNSGSNQEDNQPLSDDEVERERKELEERIKQHKKQLEGGEP